MKKHKKNQIKKIHRKQPKKFIKNSNVLIVPETDRHQKRAILYKTHTKRFKMCQYLVLASLFISMLDDLTNKLIMKIKTNKFRSIKTDFNFERNRKKKSNQASHMFRICLHGYGMIGKIFC